MRKVSGVAWRLILSGCVVLALLLGQLVGDSAAAETPYFQNKVITLVVTTGPGGGGDMWARLLAPYLSRFIPGRPGVVVRNMPSAGGVTGGNFAYHAKPNGLTLLATVGTTVMTGLTRPKGTEYKLWEMFPLLSYGTGAVYYSRPQFITKPKDIMTAKGLVFGHQNPAGGMGAGLVWSKAVLGFDCKLIWGYGGSGPANLAFITGETNLGGSGTEAYNVTIKPLVEKGEVVPIFQTGKLDKNGNIVKEKEAPDVPSVPELYEQVYNKKPSGDAFEAYKVFAGTRTYTKVLFLPPKPPKNVVDILKNTIAALMKDPQFVKDHAKYTQSSPVTYGEELESGCPKGVSGTPAALKFMKEYYAEKYGVDLE